MEIKAKKSLGQNFLVDKNIIKKIVDVAKITDDHITDSIEGWEHTARFPDEKYFTPTLWEKLWRDQTLFKRDFINNYKLS